MLSETLATGLEQYKIGPKLRALRLRKKLGLVQLGAHTGLSPAMLSKIERGQLFPTLPTLLRIALVFGVGLDHFFAREERPAVTVVRRNDRIRLPDQPGREPPAYLFESLDYPVPDRPFEVFRAEFASDAPAEPHVHDGVEFLYVMTGALEVEMEGTAVTLEEGDAIHFQAGVPHRYRRRGTGPCTAIVVAGR